MTASGETGRVVYRDRTRVRPRHEESVRLVNGQWVRVPAQVSAMVDPRRNEMVVES
jgi:hypothetical protein